MMNPTDAVVLKIQKKTHRKPSLSPKTYTSPQNMTVMFAAATEIWTAITVAAAEFSILAQAPLSVPAAMVRLPATAVTAKA